MQRALSLPLLCEKRLSLRQQDKKAAAKHRFRRCTKNQETIFKKLFCCIQLAQTYQMLVSSTGVLGSFVEELLCSFWEGAGQRGVTSLAHDELFVVSGRSLAVQGEWVLALCLQSRVEAEHIPVAAVNSAFHLFLAVGHAALDRVHLTWSVADYQGRTQVLLQ